MVCGDLEGWNGGLGGMREWEAQEGGDTCIHRVESLSCTAETNTTL